MLDGAGASTFLDLIDERSQVENSNKSIQEVKKFKLPLSLLFFSKRII